MGRSRKETCYEQALEVLAGGVDSPVRAFHAVGEMPVFAEHAKGAYVYDEDGKAYMDFIGSWGPMILGHASDVQLDGIEEVLKKGTSFGLPSKLETMTARAVEEAFPSIEKIRFVNSGTEAVMSAIRLARGATGRDKIIKFAGGYHGHADALLVDAGSGSLTYGTPSSAGVTKGAAKDTLTARYNDLNSVRALFQAYPDQVAAVIVEPVAGNMGVIAPEDGFLEGLRELTRNEGALLIFDEVITGFRTAFGGMQEVTGIQPDLTTLGKIIGGGMPVGAFGGREEVMSLLAPQGPVYQAGTLSGNPVAMKMGLNLIGYLKEHQEIYPKLERLGERIKQGIEEKGKDNGIPVSVSHQNGMLTIFFRSEVPKNLEEVQQSDTRRYALFHQKMRKRGYLLAPSQFEGMFLSDAHTDEMISLFLLDAGEVFEELS